MPAADLARADAHGRARVMRLHHAVLRLSLDPALAAAVARGEESLGLAAADLALITAVDPRAWGVDPLRRARLVTTVLEELPVIGALLGPDAVDAAVAGPALSSALGGRGSLTVEVARALVAAAGPLGAVELALAEARRAPPTAGAGVALADGAVLLTVPEGTLHAYGQARARLGEAPLLAIIDEGLRLRAPALGAAVEHLMVRATDEGRLDIQQLAGALHRLLDGLRAPRPWPQALALARKRGAGAGAERLVRELVAEGLLRHR